MASAPTDTYTFHRVRNDDAKNFEMLLRIQSSPLYTENLGPQDMDQLGEEMAKALQRCAVPESQVSIEERRFNVHLLSGIASFANHVSAKMRRGASANKNKNGGSGRGHRGDGRAGAFYILFKKTVITTTNAQCLFRMCDPAIRTGFIRQQALMILALFSEFSSSCWSLKVPATAGEEINRQHQQQPSPMMIMSYAKCQITVMGNALMEICQKGTTTATAEGEGEEGLPQECTKPILDAMCNALLRSLGSESPKEIIELINKFDWPMILQDNDVSLMQDEETLSYLDCEIHLLLHNWSCRLLVNDRNSDLAKTFLREQVGSCTKLLHTCLRRIIHEGYQMGREIQNLGRVVYNFMNCLVPVPIDRETNALVRRARNALQQVLLRNKNSDDPFLMENVNRGTYNHKGRTIKTIITNMEQWQLAHYVSDEERWEFFEKCYLSSGENLVADRRKMQAARRCCKKKVTQALGLHGGEMCANCFVLEKTILQEEEQQQQQHEGGGGGGGSSMNSCGLMKCSRCLQIKYCSRECQLEHWKKAHKNHCKSMTTKSPSSSSKKS